MLTWSSALETSTDDLRTPLLTGYGMTAGGHNFPGKVIPNEAINRRENDSKEGEKSCSCPCQCPTIEAPKKKKKKKKLSKGAIAGIAVGSVVGAALLLFFALLWLIEKFFNW